MHQARVKARPIADHPRSYPANDPAVRVDDTDTYQLQAAASELDALLLHERQRQITDARALLAELYARDGVQAEDADLDAQAEDVAALERGDRFLDELATELHPIIAAAVDGGEAACNQSRCPAVLQHIGIGRNRRGSP